MRLVQSATIGVVALTATACGGGSNGSSPEATPSREPVTEGDWYRPDPLTSWHWQLSGTTTTSYDVQIYDIDLFGSSRKLIDELHARGQRVLCYFSAGTYDPRRPDADRFPAAAIGKKLKNFPTEQWLDIRSDRVRSIIKRRMDVAAGKGCDAIEADNVNGYTQETGFALTARDQLDFNRFLANAAHRRGLGVGLKNDFQQMDQLVDYFDFAVTERCLEFSVCDRAQVFIDQGKAVFNAEYAAKYVNDGAARRRLCTRSRNLAFSTLILPVELDDSFRYTCQ